MIACQPVDGKCSQCGHPLAAGVIRTCKPGSPRRVASAEKLQRLAAMAGVPVTAIPPAKGLGDRVESMLKSIGVTEDRYKQAKELFGLPPTCNCSARKAWLNKVGEWWSLSNPPQPPSEKQQG